MSNAPAALVCRRCISFSVIGIRNICAFFERKMPCLDRSAGAIFSKANVMAMRSNFINGQLVCSFTACTSSYISITSAQ